MMKLLRNAACWLAVAVLLGLPTISHAQTQITTTTTSAAMTRGATSVALTSDTGVSAGTQIYIDGELLEAISEQGTSARWNVRRGLGGGMTPAVAHPSGARVWIGVSGVAGGSFYTYDVVSGAACATTDVPYTPFINTEANHFFDCEAGVWMQWRSDLVAVRDYTVRDSFDQGYAIMQDDGTAKSVSDDEDNFVAGSPLGAIEYREELAKTVSSWLIADGDLDVSADDGATDAEGVEILFGVAEGTDMGYIVAGTQGACLEASLTITDISATDFTLIGFRQNEAFVDNATPASYTLYNLVGIYNVEDGSILHVETGATSDDSGINWADAETRALKVCISKAGVPSAFYSAAYTSSNVLTDRPAYTEIGLVNNGTTLTAGTQLNPFFTFLNGDEGVDAGVLVNWVQLTRIP